MEAVRKIVSAELIKPVIDLPWASKDMQVEVIVFPFTEQQVTHNEGNVKRLKGCLKQYANPSLHEMEKYAWENHIVEKYAAT